MLRKTHVVYIGLFRTGIGQDHRIIPENKPVDTGIGFSNRKEALPVITFNSYHQAVFTVELYSPGIHSGIYAQTLLKEGVGNGI